VVSARGLRPNLAIATGQDLHAPEKGSVHMSNTESFDVAPTEGDSSAITIASSWTETASSDCTPETVNENIDLLPTVLSTQNGVGDFVGARIFVRDCSFPEWWENPPNQKNRAESRSAFGRPGN
jgi:hypothetical protein